MDIPLPVSVSASGQVRSGLRVACLQTIDMRVTVIAPICRYSIEIGDVGWGGDTCGGEKKTRQCAPCGLQMVKMNKGN